MNLNIRLETPQDYEAVERLTYQAFQNFRGPARDYCDEHCLVHHMRSVAGFIPELDYVAEWQGQLVGSILYTASHIHTPDGNALQTLTFGPVSMPPEQQGKGIGDALIRFTLDKARTMGHRAVLITGHTAYYPRFGFRPAAEYGITMPDGSSFDAFMALELFPGALSGVSGKCRFDAVYELTKEQVAAFNKARGYPQI